MVRTVVGPTYGTIYRGVAFVNGRCGAGAAGHPAAPRAPQKMVFSFAKTKPRASAPATTRKGFLAMSRAVFLFAPPRPTRARVNEVGACDARRGAATVMAVACLDAVAERLT